jgi:glycosyltransferase involved in cell wall biosynthesis
MTDENFDQIANKLKPIDLPPLPEKPLVSVLMTSYNYGRFIGEAIESVLKQTYQNFEIVVCDDGSIDNSFQVVQQYVERDPRVSLIVKENGGFASALNACYSACRGEVAALLDADDIYTPEKLEAVVNGFRRNGRAGMCVHWYVVIVGGVGSWRDSFPRHVPLPEGWVAPEALRTGGAPYPLGPTSCLSFRRPLAERLFPIPLRLAMVDNYLSYVAQFLTEVCAVRVPLTRYRLHGQNMTNMTAGAGMGGPSATAMRAGDNASAAPPAPDCMYLPHGIETCVEELALVVRRVQEFLETNFGPEVAGLFRIEDNPHYWRYLLALYLLGRGEGERIRGHAIGEVVNRVGSPRHVVLARLLMFLPASVARRAVLLWWHPSKTRSMLMYAARAILGV